MQNSLTGGLLFGFSALKPSIEKIECSNGSTVNFDEVFTLSMSANMFAPLLLAGPILDMLGPRVCSCVSAGMVAFGFLLFGFSSLLPGCSASYFLPSILLIGVGGPGCQCSLFQLANLFESRGFALNLITCCISLSFVVFELLAGWSDSQNISLQTPFLVFGFLPLICMVVGFFVMTDKPYDRAEIFPEPLLSTVAEEGSPSFRSEDKASIAFARPFHFRRKRAQARNLREGDSFANSFAGGLPVINADEEQERAPSLRAQLFSQGFLELTLFFVIASFFANLFLGNMQDMAQSTLPSTQHDAAGVAATYVSNFFRFSPLSSMCNPLVGLCIDRLGLQVILAMTLTLCAVYALSLWLGSFLVGATLFSVFSTSYFSYTYSNLAFEFGFEYYGLLAGIIQAIGSLVLLVLQPVVRGAAGKVKDGWSKVQILQVIIVGTFGLLILSSRLFQLLYKRSRSQISNGSVGSGVGASMQVDRSREGLPRAFSEADASALDGDNACRRRPNLFPNVDDILLIDGAHSHHSHAAYKLEKSSSPILPLPRGQALSPVTENGRSQIRSRDSES